MLESCSRIREGIVMTPALPSSTDRTSRTISTPLRPRRRGIVIGASSGIGAALARRLAREGYVLGLIARRDELLTALATDINSAAGEPLAYPYAHDVRVFHEVPELLRRIIADIGGLDLAAYVAGANLPPGPNRFDFSADRAMMEVNLLGAMAWLDPVASLFLSAHAGQIVGISSVAADRGRVGNPGYNASKSGLTTYLEALRNRLARHGVHVLTVKPGFVKTEQLKAALKVLFPISADAAADQIWRAMRGRKQLIYTPAWWRLVMFGVRNIPSVLFRRMSF